MQVRVITANLHGLRAGIEGAAGLLESEDVDIAMLQETGPRRSFSELAARLRMDRVSDPRAFLRRRVQNGLLLRSPWRVVAVQHRRFESARAGSWHPRGAVIALLGHGTTRLWAVSTHLGLEGGERRRNADELHAMLADRVPFVLGGDLNAGEGSRAVAILSEGAVDVGRTAGPTFPASDPLARIDYLFVSPEILARSVTVAGDNRVSDHRAVMADLTLPLG